MPIEDEIRDRIQSLRRASPAHLPAPKAVPDIARIRRVLGIGHATLGKMLDVAPVRVAAWERWRHVDDPLVQRMLVMMDDPDGSKANSFLLPREFDDVEVPVIRGRPLWHAEDEDFHAYLDWLADHLVRRYAAEFPRRTPCLERDLGDAAMLGHDFSWHLMYCIEPFEPLVNAGVCYEEAVLAIWRDFLDVIEDEWIAERFEADTTYDVLPTWITPAIWKNAIREVQELRRVKADYADLGYRRRLAELVLPYSSHQHRRSILEAFYNGFWEMMTK